MLDFEAALEANPRLGEAYFSRGIARRELGDLAGAIADFERALEVSPPGWRHRGSTESHLAAARAAGR
ncbi:MAG: tetratricopeptide repeat protein [Planctomycetales bacterium]|nr:tetratricopeptide repeat protein [Planctomycetales bacterium]